MRKSELKEIIKSSFLAEAEDSKKGNSEEQKRAEGAIRDNKKHIKKLAADLKFQEEKLAKLKKDSKKDIVKEAEEVDVEDNEDIDIDIEDTVDIDDEETESDIEIKTSVPGEDTDVEAVQGLLTKAQAEAAKLGDDKLLDQIGNTITYFTRAHVVKSANEELESGEYGDPVDAELDVTKGGGDVAGILDAESELNLQEGAADNLELKSLAKTLYSGFKKMGADVELTANKMRLNKRPSDGNMDSKDVFIYAGDEAVEVNLVGEKAGGFFDKIQKDFPKFEFKDRGDSKTWEDKTVKNLAIFPGKGMSETLNEEVARFKKLAGIIK